MVCGCHILLMSSREQQPGNDLSLPVVVGIKLTHHLIITGENFVIFTGQVMAHRDVPTTGASTVTYLHGDHLGSVATTSTSNASLKVTKQYFTPWG